MKTKPLFDKSGSQYAFEIENVFISLNSVTRVLSYTTGVQDVIPERFFSRSEYRIRFLYQGKQFVVWEPYGDSSTYWIGPENPKDTVDITPLEKEFNEYQPSMSRRIIGTILSIF